MNLDPRVNSGRGQWTLSFVVSTFGLAAFAIVILITAVVLGGLEYSVVTVVVAIAGLILALRGIGAWVSARWVRRAIDEKRRAGVVVWPVRAESTAGRWQRVGMLEASETGVTITVAKASVDVGWDDLATVELAEGGPLKPASIVLDGPSSGRLVLEVLQPNAVARGHDDDTRACAVALEELRSRSR